MILGSKYLPFEGFWLEQVILILCSIKMWVKEICFDNSKLKLGQRIFCTPHDGAEVRLRFIIQRLQFKVSLPTNHDNLLSFEIWSCQEIFNIENIFLCHLLSIWAGEVFILIWCDIFIQKIIPVVCQSQSFADGPRQGWTPNKYLSHIIFWFRRSERTTGNSYKHHKNVAMIFKQRRLLRHVGITMIKCRKRFMNNASSKYKVDYIDTALCGHFISIDAAFKRIWWGHKSLFSLPVDVLTLSITLLIRPLVVWERYEDPPEISGLLRRPGLALLGPGLI